MKKRRKSVSQPAGRSPVLKEPSSFRYFKKMLVRFGLAKKIKHRDGAVFFQFIWKRIALLLVVMAFVGYSVLVAGAYYFIKYERGFAEIRYFDLFFPHRWEDYRVSRGDYYIERAQKILAGDEAIEGHPFLLLRTGVGLSPRNDEGRLALARFYQQIGQRSTAIQVLESRLEENTRNIEYLQTYLMMLFDNFEERRIIEVGERLLAEGVEDTSRRDHMLATAVATAYHYRGGNDRAEEYIDKYGLMTAKDGFLLQTRIDWERGAEDLAIRRLENAIDGGTADHDVFLVLVDYLLSTGREEKASRVALLRHINDPLSHEPLEGLLQVHQRRGNEEMLREDTELYFSQFGREEEAMRHLSELAGSWGDYELAARIHRHCLERDMNTEAPAYHWIEALVSAGRYARAIEVMEEWDETPAAWERGYEVPLKTQAAAAQFGAGNRGEGRLLLNELLGEEFVRPDHFTTLARRLMEVGEDSPARQVLRHVHHNHPLFRKALSTWVELDIETRHRGEVLNNVQRYIAMRQPSNQLLRKAYAYIGSDVFLFETEREEVLHSLKSVLEET